MEEVGEHADAALLDLGRLRVLGVVDEVAVQVLGDHPLRLGLHPGGHERGQVAHRDPVEHQLLADQPHGVDRGHAVLRQLVVGRRLEQEAVAELAGEFVELSAENEESCAVTVTPTVEHQHTRGQLLDYRRSMFSSSVYPV